MLIIGHRGAAGLAAENTISSLKIGEEEAQAIEFDLRATEDKHIIVIHDESLSRTLGIEKSVGGMTLSEVKRLSKKAGIEIPTLEEWLKACPRYSINPEIKETGFEAKLLKELKTFASKVLVVTSWNPIVIKRIRALDGNIRLGAILAVPLGVFLPVYLWLLKKWGVSWITLSRKIASPKIISQIKKRQMEVYVYTINDPSVAEELKAWGVDGIYTDRPDIIRQ